MRDVKAWLIFDPPITSALAMLALMQLRGMSPPSRVDTPDVRSLPFLCANRTAQHPVRHLPRRRRFQPLYLL